MERNDSRTYGTIYRSSRNGLTRICSIRQVTTMYSSYKRQRILRYECMGPCMNCLLTIVFATKLSLNRFIQLLNHSEEVVQMIMLLFHIVLFIILFHSARWDTPLFQRFLKQNVNIILSHTVYLNLKTPAK